MIIYFLKNKFIKLKNRAIKLITANLRIADGSPTKTCEYRKKMAKFKFFLLHLDFLHICHKSDMLCRLQKGKCGKVYCHV